MTIRSLKSRLARLEQRCSPRPPYVLRVSSPPTTEERAAIAAAHSRGWRFAVLPYKSASIEQWVAECARPEVLH